MAEAKTRPTGASVAAYIDALPDARQRADCRRLMQMMSRVTGAKPVLWGPSIVGFGSYRYVYASGRSGDWPLTGFAPRGRELSLYVMDGFDRRKALLAGLGPHKTGKSCLYVKSLAGLDLKLLESLLSDSVAVMQARHPAAGDTASAAAKPSAVKRSAAKRPAVKRAAPAQAPARTRLAKTAAAKTAPAGAAARKKDAAKAAASKARPSKAAAAKTAATQPAAGSARTAGRATRR